MKKILAILSLAAANTLMGQALITEADVALLEKLKTSSPFTASSATQMGIGDPQMLSLRGITKVGKFWYFSIYDASLNSSFWVQLKDGDRELSLIKAEFFDDENKELEISTSSYTHILALKERDALTGAVPNIPGSAKKSSSNSTREQMGKMLSSMSSQQKAGLMGHLAATMMMGNQQNGQNNQQSGKNNQQSGQKNNQQSGNYNSNNSNNRSSSSGSSSRSSSGGSSNRSSSGGSSSRR